MTRIRLGLIVLQSDETIEDEFRRMLSDIEGVSLWHTRIPSESEVTSDKLQKMETRITSTANLFPEGVTLDVVGYACTSGAAVLGEDRVRELVKRSCGEASVTNPLTALKEGLSRLGIGKLGLVVPYVEEVTKFLANVIEEEGNVKIVGVKTFGQSREEVVARIDETSIKNAVLTCGEGVDGVFVSCTNLRTLGIIREAEQELGKPVLSSNGVLCWHMLRLAGGSDNIASGGRLFLV